MIEILNGKIILDDNYEIREYYTANGNARAFYSNDCLQSIMYIDKNKRKEVALDYFKFYDLPIDLNPEGTDYLMLGGGVLAYSNHYLNKYQNKNMDVIELNEKCIEYAKIYFYLDELINSKRLNVFIDNAINYISICSKKYDYILIDLFDGKNPINEIYNSCNIIYLKKILNNNGIIIINYILSNKNVDSYKDYLINVLKLMKHYKIITHEQNFIKNRNIGNIIIILSNTEIKIPKNYDYIDLTNII